MANPCTSIYTTKSFADEQPDWSFLLRFRQEPIAVTCDIEGMFHQVHVNPERCDLLRFLWREEILDPGSWILDTSVLQFTCSASRLNRIQRTRRRVE